MLCVFAPGVLIASRKDGALLKRRKLGWASERVHGVLYTITTTGARGYLP